MGESDAEVKAYDEASIMIYFGVAPKPLTEAKLRASKCCANCGHNFKRSGLSFCTAFNFRPYEYDICDVYRREGEV